MTEKAAIRLYDNVLDHKSQAAVLAFLSGPGWSYGAYSGRGHGAAVYWYKHFAGFSTDATAQTTPEHFDRELARTAPLVHSLWTALRRTTLKGHNLLRCYANAYPYGSEGSVHTDSNVKDHWTSIYYPSLDWSADFAGETLFFNDERTDIIAAAYPTPNRLVVFPGATPHVARGVTRQCPLLRITLMFKTLAVV